tara:strand:+ start:1182 stop:1373 length:192 start_codon:yes stop_codon:yes gene_type:complete
MTFDEAIKKSIKVFLKGKLPIKTGELKKDGLMFTPEYFDDLEAEMLENPIDSKTAKEEATDES